MRAEHIALHAAEEFGGAQYYVGCAQLSVTGSGAGSPSPVTKIPGQYTGYESGLIIDIYYPIPTNYTAAGEVTWPGACDSHTANLEGQTYLGLCVNEDGSAGASGTAVASSAAPTTTAAAVSTTAISSSKTTVAAAITSSIATKSSVATPVTASSSPVTTTTAATATPTGTDEDDDVCEA